MKPPFSLVVVHGDGSRVSRLSVPRWIAYATLGLEAALLAVMVEVFSGGYTTLRQETEALRARVDDQRTLLDVFEQRLPVLREEVRGWKALHAKMWKAFGLPPGRVAMADTRGPAAEVPPREELTLLGADVAEEAPRLRELKRVVSRTSRMVNALPLRWPVRGPINSQFGLRRSPWTGMPEPHHGIDIGSARGTPVKSPAAGTVVAANARGRLGKHVALDHGYGVTSLYGHLQALDVGPGQRVGRGQVLGLVGNSGRSTGPHLHYELLVDGKPVDPRGFLARDAPSGDPVR